MNDELVTKILALSEGASSSAVMALKIAAGLIKQMDPYYRVSDDSDPRIKLSDEEIDRVTDSLEVWNRIAIPKRGWGTPEWRKFIAAGREDL